MERPFVIAIGFSAGGIEPLKEFFEQTPHDNAAYIILQHLPVNYRTQLDKILQRHSVLKVSVAKQGDRLEKDKVYIQPSDACLSVSDGHLVLAARTPAVYPNHSIDHFLSSAAAEFPGHCAAVILCGAGADGSNGIRAIKKQGGLVLVQDPDTCSYRSMPEAAIGTGCVDHVLHVMHMPSVLMQFAGTVGG